MQDRNQDFDIEILTNMKEYFLLNLVVFFK